MPYLATVRRILTQEQQIIIPDSEARTHNEAGKVAERIAREFDGWQIADESPMDVTVELENEETEERKTA